MIDESEKELRNERRKGHEVERLNSIRRYVVRRYNFFSYVCNRC